MTAPYLLDKNHKTLFPDVELALREPDGLLAIGGDLSSERLLAAYKNGIFPWYSEEHPILWWSPDPRMVLKPSDVKVSRSLAKTIKKQKFTITFDQDFENVIRSCSKPRLEKGQLQDQTWILEEMINAYINMHNKGYAHSIECWLDDKLVGGLYGIALGQVFFGESMFSRVSDASKTAFVFLCKQLEKWNFKLIDCQVYTSHLANLGAAMIPRHEFIEVLNDYATTEGSAGKWTIDPLLPIQLIDSLSA